MAAMTDEELKSTVIALQLKWHGAYAVGTTPAGGWFAVPVEAPDARIEADGPLEPVDKGSLTRDGPVRIDVVTAGRCAHVTQAAPGS